MKKDSLDMYDVRPKDMVNYLKYYGMHFNKKMCEFAVKLMYVKDIYGNKEYIEPLLKDVIDSVLKSNNVVLENNQMYDYVYVANMCKSDFFGSSINDEKSMALYIKDVIDDQDAYDGMVFNRWYADMCRRGIAIDWDSML